MEQMVSFMPPPHHPLRKDSTATPTEQEDDWDSETVWNLGIEDKNLPNFNCDCPVVQPTAQFSTHIPVVQPITQVYNP